MDPRNEGTINEIEGNSKSHQQQPESTPVPMPCLRLCGFFANPETHNLCSQCYRDYRKELEAFMSAFKKKKEALAAEAAAASATNTFTSCEDDDATSTITKKINRCNSCKKKVGLTGFSCRCGGMFCGLHRYPEEHACDFDFKKQARLALAMQNPLCIADKLNYRALIKLLR